jgi:putative DNA primase/helicase
MTHYEVRDVRDAANGQWVNLLGILAPSLSPAIDRLGRHVPCPMHGGKDGFRLYRDSDKNGAGICNQCGSFKDGFDLLQEINGWNFGETIRELGNELFHGYAPSVLPKRKKVVTTKPQVFPSSNNRIEKLWDTAIPLYKGCDSATMYLARRKIVVPAKMLSSSLRFKPSLGYYEEGQKLADYGTLIAAVRDVNEKLVTVHRIYLDRGRKAPVQSPKKLYPVPEGRRLTGCSVQIGGPAKVLGVAEGIETSLAVMKATGKPCWAAINANNLERFIPPKITTHVNIWADNDRSQVGYNSALVLQERLEEMGIIVCIMLPPRQPSKSRDWNDVMQDSGIKAFPGRFS